MATDSEKLDSYSEALDEIKDYRISEIGYEDEEDTILRIIKDAKEL